MVSGASSVHSTPYTILYLLPSFCARPPCLFPQIPMHHPQPPMLTPDKTNALSYIQSAPFPWSLPLLRKRAGSNEKRDISPHGSKGCVLWKAPHTTLHATRLCSRKDPLTVSLHPGSVIHNPASPATASIRPLSPALLSPRGVWPTSFPASMGDGSRGWESTAWSARTRKVEDAEKEPVRLLRLLLTRERYSSFCLAGITTFRVVWC